MRKLLFPVAVVVLLGIAAAFVLLKHRTVRQVRAADLLPPETVLLAELPNLSRTAERWSQTALQQLWQEPELQAFIEQPRAKHPALKGSDAWPEIVAQVRPQQAFFAITSIGSDVPQMIAGFSFLGSRSAVEQALEHARASFKAAYPAGKAELVTDAGTDIETYVDGPHVLAEAFRDNWYFASNNLELLKATLSRYADTAESHEPSLAGKESFQKSFAPLPSDPELALFIQPQAAVQRLQSLVTATGQLDSLAASLHELAQVRAFTATSKIEGADFHDSWFVLTPETQKGTPLPRHALALTTPETALFYAARAEIGEVVTDAQKQPMLAGLLGLSSLNARGIKLPQLSKALGPELALLLDWPPSDLPAPGIVLDVRDPKPLREALETLAAPDASGAQWGRSEAGGATLYRPPSAGFLLPQIIPSIGLGDRFLTLTFGNSALASRAQKPGNDPAATVTTSPPFQAAAASVGEATESFGYVHTAALVERAYTALRPVLAMSVAFNPDLSPYIDAGKLPSAEILAKHLGSTAYVKRSTAEGILSESKGPVTYDQAVTGTLVLYGVAAFPMAKQMLQGGALTSGLVPSVPSLPPATGAPPAAVPPPAAARPVATPPPAAPAPAPVPGEPAK